MEKNYIFKNHRILFLDFDVPIEKYPQMTCASLYRDLSGWEKNRFKIAEHFSGSDMSQWYGAWKHEINKYDTVFLCDGGRGSDIVSYLNKVSPNIRVIIYYVNTIFPGEKNEPSRYKGLNCEMYTFDIENARQYNICFKHFFYHYMPRENEDKIVDVIALNDIFFVGVDKNRLTNLLKLKKQFTEMGLSCDFHIKRTHNRLYLPRQKNIQQRRLFHMMRLLSE